VSWRPSDSKNSFTLALAYFFIVWEEMKIFGHKREEDRSWRELSNDELHSLYSSSNIVKVIKPIRMRWAGHVARMGDGKIVYRFWVEDRREETTGKT
jgi:hypothetical protein